jgi:hypothetical protein
MIASPPQMWQRAGKDQRMHLTRRMEDGEFKVAVKLRV